MRLGAIIPACCVLVLGCATSRGSASKQALNPATLTQESAVAFVQGCVLAWSKRDDALWDQIVDEAFFPKGAWPVMLNDGKEPRSDIWVTSMPGLTKWLSSHSVGEISNGLRAVDEVKTKELRDYSHLSLEELRTAPSRPPHPKVQVQALALGLDLNGDGKVSLEETTRVHLHKGAFYWEPFGW
jgi:hypothetical protein